MSGGSSEPAADDSESHDVDDSESHDAQHPRQQPPRPRWRRAFFLITAAFALVVGLAAVVAVVAIRRYDAAVAKDELIAPEARAGDSGQRSMTYLIIGSDQRASRPEMGQRADTIIIAHIPAGQRAAYLISVPRDLYVTIPANPALGFTGTEARINAALEFGHGGATGARLLSQTLTSLSGIRFDGAATLDFTGLRRAVDVLGGVDMCVRERTISIHTRRIFEVGCREMNSAEVLDFLRQRNFDDGDFTRQRNQQQFLKAVLERALSTGTLTNPVKLDALLRAIAGSLTVDTGGVALPDLVFTLRDLRPNMLVGVRLPCSYDMVGNQSVVLPTPDATGLFTAIRDDTVDIWVAAHPRWVNQI